MSFKTKFKFIGIIPILAMTGIITSCSSMISYNKIYSNFVTTEVKNNQFIKGGDISSYAEIMEEFLWSKKIVKQDLNSDTVSNYKYDELETTYIYDESLNRQTTLYDYVNNHMFSYIDENNNKKYANLLYILKNEVGLNSIRIRTFVNPYDENNNSYGGGHNDLDTTIWLIKEAKKYGFENINLDFHYSDFWADPHRQNVPKEWSNLSTEEMNETIKNYTFDSLVKIYESTNTYPNVIQIGNEITKGLIWNTKDNQTFESGHFDYETSAKYLSSAIDGINKFETFINAQRSIKIGLHLDDATGSLTPKVLKKYFNNNYVYENIDIIFLTWYPMWQSNFDNLFSVIKNSYIPYNKEIQVVEFSNVWTENESEFSFDNTNRSFIGIMPYSISGQTMMTYQLMDTLSKALPNSTTGFYYWEPAWSQVGRTTWASHEGILYSYNTNNDNIKSVNEGNSWWNYSLFDNSNTLLSTARIIKDYQRISDNFTVYKNTINRIRNNIKNPIKNAKNSFYDSFIGNKNPLKISQNFKKIDINNEIIDFYNYTNKNNNNLTFYNDLNEENLDEQISKLIKQRYTRINWDEANILDINFDLSNKKGSAIISANQNSFLYENQTAITFEFKDYYSNSIDFSNLEISIDKNDSNWSSKLFEIIKNNVSDLGTTIWNAFQLNGGISDDYSKVWFYDNTYKQNRDAEWLLLKTDKVFEDNNLANYYQVNNYKFSYPKTLSELTNKNSIEIYFGFKVAINSYLKSDDFERKSDLSKIGTENWVKFPALLFKFNIALI